ncbi:MAG TPA: hypothetical protein VKU80_15225 [Planctomycetota bacterium]|nr:hypothetical protein [Planctomycetota bacterium]
MGADQDLLFGKIAVNRKYCTPEEIEKGLSIQARSPDPLPLGHILVNEGFITEEQHSEILVIQRRNLSAVDPVQRASKESILLGKLAVRERFVTERDVNTCLRLQAQKGEKRSLGEIMVAQGYLASKQLGVLLALQQKKIMSCPACRLSYTVLTISQGKTILCPRCRAALQEGKPTDSVRTDAMFDTTVVRKIRQDGSKPPPRKESPAASSVRLVRMTCPICSKLFQEPVDTKGQVICPSCHSSFSA